MKRLFVTLLIGLAVFFLLPPDIVAQKSLKELFCAQAGALLSVQEGDFAATVKLKMPSSVLSSNIISLFVGEIADLKFNLSGNYSKKTGQAAAALSAAPDVSLSDKVAPLTDVIVDGGKIYLNLRTVFSFFESIYGVPFKYSSYFSADYIRFTPEEIGALGISSVPLDIGVLAACPKFTAMGLRVLKTVMDSLKDEYFSSKDGVFTMSLDNNAFKSVGTAVLSDVGASTGEYADALIELMSNSPGYLASNGLTADKVRTGRDGLIASLKKAAADAISTLGSLSDISVSATISYDSSVKAYNLNFYVTGEKENLKIAVDLKLNQKAAANISPPKKSMSIEEVINELGGGSSEL